MTLGCSPRFVEQSGGNMSDYAIIKVAA